MNNDKFDLPSTLKIPSAWFGSILGTKPDKWRWDLTPPEIEELIEAAEKYQKSGKDTGSITAASFHLPLLGTKLKALKISLIKGLGFEVVRGLPVESLGRNIIETIFCGIGSHIGSFRKQNAAGDLLGHVRDIGVSSKDDGTRIYQTNERQTFHTDSADVVGLLCLNQAKQGGESMLVSAITIYNEILQQRPELLPFLFDRIATDRRGEIPTGSKPYFEIPVFNWHEGYLTVMYQRQYIDSAQRFPDAPRLTKKHIEALDLFDSLANDPRLYLSMRLQPGDMQFVYNHNLLHDRTAFVDYEDPQQKRHLLRLWLSVAEDRPLPAWFAERYGSVERGNRGGVNI